ncbi:alpha/beta hydrolase family protein [Chryseobacterium taiwanense]|nr:prolyl oligopeptidase family serine peptidase [Chryseobacterium taiwanense]
MSGHSFGGYETAFLMTQNKWFTTGIAGAGFVDLPRQAMSYHKFSYLNYVPDYARIESQQNRMIKSLFENYQGYLDNSPIYHLKKLSKPILLWAGKDDDNIHIDQSRSFFIGMKRLGKKGILLEYANEKHNLRSQENQLDLNVKAWQWMDFYLKSNKPSEWIRPMLE